MIIYYSSRDKARNNKGNGRVVDCKDNKSINGSRWGVKIK